MITSKTPTDWRQLQDEAGRILRECGMDVLVDRPTPTVRGTVAIDVYATEQMHGRAYTVLCECKLWQASVPQQVIHAFRTVVHDTGANIGYVIAPSGFQRGAIQEATFTNTKLVTWEEFQDEFETTWLTAHLMPTVTDATDAFMTLSEPLRPRAYARLSSPRQQAFDALCDEFLPLHLLVMELSTYMRMFGHRPWPSLPLRNGPYRWTSGLPADLVDLTGYRELLEATISHALAAADRLRAALEQD